ncbi:MAG: hypothetical protein ACM3PY_04530 [Omnitrophica WOR_2 bacterium]
MSISHRKAFDLWVRGMDAWQRLGTGAWQADRLPEDALPGLEGEAPRQLRDHLEGCPECSQDLKLYLRVRRELHQRGSMAGEPYRSASDLLQTIQNRQAATNRLGGALAPARLVGLVILLASAVLVLSWILSFLRPEPVALPLASPTFLAPAPAVEPTRTAAPVLPKTPIQPAIPAGLYEFGGWSPDSRYILISQHTRSGVENSDRMYSSFFFYDTRTRESCPAAEPLLGSAYSRGSLDWTPDGRLLVVSPKGVLIYTPCSQEIESITGLFDEPVQSIALSRGKSWFLLLGGKKSYWIYDSASRTASRLDGLVPGEGSADHIAWSPSGNEAVFSQPAGAGSQISLVDLQTGQILEQAPTSSGTQQNAAWVEWILPGAIMVYGGPDNTSLLLERRPGAPMKATPNWMDLMGLKLPAPGMVSAEGSYGDLQRGIFHLVLAYETPEKRFIYLYHSDGSRLETLAYDVNTILLFPDGQAMPLNILENNPTYNDTYQVIWVDDPGGKSTQIQVQGHTPRQYPQLTGAWDAQKGLMAFGSTQGVSLVSLEDGRLVEFWKLAGHESNFTNLVLSPDGKNLAVQADFGQGSQYGMESELYLIALTE